MRRKSILFLCTGNSCRSQMAEGWAKYLFGDLLTVFSAGIKPQGIDPLTVKSMAEAGVNITGQRSKHLCELPDITFDLVVTVCDSAKENCPIFPNGVKKIHRSFDDPPCLSRNAASEEEALYHYRRVCEEIRNFVSSLPKLL